MKIKGKLQVLSGDWIIRRLDYLLKGLSLKSQIHTDRIRIRLKEKREITDKEKLLTGHVIDVDDKYR